MFKNRVTARIIMTIAAFAAGLISGPVLLHATEPQLVPATVLDPVELEPISVVDEELTAEEIRSADTSEASAAGQGQSSLRPIEPRQLALIVLLLSTLGVATRLLWRRHLRALSSAQDEDVDEEMRSN